MSQHDHHHPHLHDHDHHDHDHDHLHGESIWARLRHALTPHSHDAADKVDAAVTSSDRGIRAVKISLIALIITAAAQLIIVAISGSVALLADTIHNFSDALSAIPLWIAFVLGRRPASRRFTYGLGRIEDLAGLFIVVLIAISAVAAGWHSINRLLNPEPMSHVGWVALAGIVGFLGNEGVALYRIKIGREIGSAALVADGYHARTDGFTSLAVLLGAVATWLGYPIADPIIGLVITAAICMVLVTTGRDIFTRLLDGVDEQNLALAERAVAETPGVLRQTQLRLRWVGHELMAESTIEVDRGLSLAEADAIAHQVTDALRARVPHLASATVHTHAQSAAV